MVHLLIYGDSFSTSSLQFRFKLGLSADMCTGLIKNVISRYSFNGSKVLGCFLDASKALFLIVLVTLSYLVSSWRKISHQLSLGCNSRVIGIKSPQFSRTKPSQGCFQSLMEEVLYHLYSSLFILMNYCPDWNLRVLAAIGRTILLELLGIFMTLFFWLLLPQHLE